MSKKAQAALTGATLALAMAGLTSAVQAAPAGSSASSTDLVHCYGVNVCKGHNDCKTEKNACGGHASCKGTGFVAMPSKSCKVVGGALKDTWKGSIAKTELVSCQGIKGVDVVKTPAKACADIGGTTKKG